MKLEWIDDLLAIADAGSLSRAASQRFLTQPAFSRRIRAIERSLGTELIDRRHKPVNLKPTIAEMEPKLREASRQLHALRHELSRANQRQRELVIVSQHAISTAIAPQLIQRISSDQEVHVRLRSANREECYALLFSGQADIGLLYQIEDEQPIESTRFVETIPIASEPLVPVISKQNEVLFRRELKNGLIRAVAYPSNVFLGSLLARYVQPLTDSDIDFHWVTETALTTAALQLASIGIGVAWVPLSLANDALSREELVQLDPDLPTISMMVVATRMGMQSNTDIDGIWSMLAST